MSANLVFYVCVLCVVCGVGVYGVLCDVCCGFLCVVGFVLCVCLSHGCRRGSSGIKPTSSVEDQELGCPPRRLQAHVEEDANAHLLAACSQASIG